MSHVNSKSQQSDVSCNYVVLFLELTSLNLFSHVDVVDQTVVRETQQVSSQTGPRLSRLQRLLIISNNDHHHSSEFALTTDDKESKNLLKSPLIQNKDPDNNVVLDQPHLALQSSQLSMSVETHGGSKEPTQHLRLNHTLQHLNRICER
ncbi:uncharacterized protein LOC127845907 [Dreissena polymorpha]|uniref:uncharacterized protein LOC127845907 n=1 Tax=Dreissena polymorpha TaxID=45954 RepID=UPI002264CBEA|nr:uncharacterized protein LOC127845907 [Dreissena polymorpha]